MAFVQSDLECVQRGFAVVQLDVLSVQSRHLAVQRIQSLPLPVLTTVQREFVGVQSNLDALQRDRFPVQNDFNAVYSDFAFVQSD